MKKRTGIALAICTALVAVAFVAASARGEDSVKEDKFSFETSKSFGGKPYILLGTGLRYKSIIAKIEVYEAGFYVEEAGAKEKWAEWVGKNGKDFLGADGKPDWAKIKASGKFFGWIFNQGFGHALVMKFRRNVTATQVRDAYVDTLTRTITNPEEADVKDDYNKFLDGIAHDVSEGQTMIVRSAGNKVFVTGPSTDVTVENAKLRKAVWRIWFGPKPIQEPLKKGLVKLAQVLGWAEPPAQ